MQIGKLEAECAVWRLSRNPLASMKALTLDTDRVAGSGGSCCGVG